MNFSATLEEVSSGGGAAPAVILAGARDFSLIVCMLSSQVLFSVALSNSDAQSDLSAQAAELTKISDTSLHYAVTGS